MIADADPRWLAGRLGQLIERFRKQEGVGGVGVVYVTIGIPTEKP
jgi:hypothetical protein